MAVEVWTPDLRLPEVQRSLVRWHPAGASTSLTVDLMELFAEE